MLPPAVKALTTGFPSTNDHRCSTRLDPAACSARVAWALPMADVTFPRLRTIPASPISRSTSSSPKAATVAGSKSANARR